MDDIYENYSSLEKLQIQKKELISESSFNGLDFTSSIDIISDQVIDSLKRLDAPEFDEISNKLKESIDKNKQLEHEIRQLKSLYQEIKDCETNIEDDLIQKEMLQQKILEKNEEINKLTSNIETKSKLVDQMINENASIYDENKDFQKKLSSLETEIKEKNKKLLNNEEQLLESDKVNTHLKSTIEKLEQNIKI